MQRRYDHSEVGWAIKNLADDLEKEFSAASPLVIVGIRTRGETLAQRVVTLLRDHGFHFIERGVLDITLYRDDLSEIGPRPMVRPTHMPFAIDGKPLVLVDDVLFTGRSVRAALDALNDFGRPRMIRLAVLVDRGGRELPIRPDYVGLPLLDIPPDHRVNVRLRDTDDRDEILIEPRG